MDDKSHDIQVYEVIHSIDNDDTLDKLRIVWDEVNPLDAEIYTYSNGGNKSVAIIINNNLVECDLISEYVYQNMQVISTSLQIKSKKLNIIKYMSNIYLSFAAVMNYYTYDNISVIILSSFKYNEYKFMFVYDTKNNILVWSGYIPENPIWSTSKRGSNWVADKNLDDFVDTIQWLDDNSEVYRLNTVTGKLASNRKMTNFKHLTISDIIKGEMRNANRGG